jgi:large conductance mechanosensitive channel
MMLKGFRDFILRGNALDLAVAVVIGAAFSGVVKALSEGFIAPLIALAGGAPDTSSLNLGAFRWGDILGAVLNFLITAGVVYFVVVLPMNRLLGTLGPSKAHSTRKCPECLSEIPRAARRCAHCTAQVQPLPPD